jgi:hypothetical protein
MDPHPTTKNGDAGAVLHREGRYVRLEVETLNDLISFLREDGYEVIGPVLRNDAIIPKPVQSSEDLARGWIDEQGPASYHVKRSGEQWFGASSSPSGWKQFLYPPQLRLFRSRRSNGSVTIEEPPRALKPFALLGLRPCDLEAINIQDKVFLEGGYSDPWYSEARRTLFTIVVACARPGGNMFL